MDTGELRNLLCYWYSAKKSEEFITMRILYAASEARPFAASGGLADVAGSLPKALCAAGEEAPEVMDSEYIAILLGLTVQHVRTLTRSGELPAVKVGKTYRYDKGQIMKRLGALEEATT